MNVGFIGAGKLGLTVALATESRGHDVRVCDPDPRIPEAIETRRFPHDEDGAQELWERSAIQVASVSDLVEWAHIIFVAVQTPHDPEYEGITPMPETRRDFDYTYLKTACAEVAEEAQRAARHVVLSVISTVLPGTMDREVRPLLNGYVHLVYNPSFIAMGTTIRDFLDPEFTLMGTDEDGGAVRAGEIVESFYHSIHDAPVYWTGVREAELSKVAYNTALSMKLGLINALAMLCDASGANVDEVSNALSLAHRRLWDPNNYFRAGMGDGGGCHPRDNIALSWLAQRHGLPLDVFGELIRGRETHAKWLAAKVEAEQAKTGLPVVVLGRAYKPNTRLTAGSPALLLAHYLTEADVKFDHLDADEEYVGGPAIFFIATNHAQYANLQVPPRSVVIDPWGSVAHQAGVRYVTPGRP